MMDIRNFAALATRDHGLCVVTTLRADATVQTSVVSLAW